MATKNRTKDTAKLLPKATIVKLLGVWSIVAILGLWGGQFLNNQMSTTLAMGFFVVLLLTIIVAAFGVVKEADALAHQLGEPYGTLILTLSIVSIEVILISAVMIGPGENPTIGKDSIFSVMMIIMNLVIGLCILLGAMRHGEQEYNAQGSMSYHGMIIMLGGIGMLLPNFIQGAGNGIFSTTQAVVLATLIIFLYGSFLFLQMKGYRHLYMQPAKGKMSIPFEERYTVSTGAADATSAGPKKVIRKEIWIRSLILFAMILPIVLLSHHMAVVVDYGIKAANLPPLFGGVLIAIIVFTPESMTAVKAALNNEFQRAINLCHGAFVSTVGITVPAILIIGLISGKTVMFGLNATEMILFIITLLLSLMTFLGKRTTPIWGLMHLVLFVTFILLVFNP